VKDAVNLEPYSSFCGVVTASAIKVMRSANPACTAESRKENKALHIVCAWGDKGILAIEDEAPRSVTPLDHTQA
jgi:hypothetical protein